MTELQVVEPPPAPRPAWRDTSLYLIALAGVALLYVALARLGLTLAFINPSATAVWPATGIAVAAVLLFGYRIWPAILVGAFAANAMTAGTWATSASIAAGNCLEALIIAWLVNRWSQGVETFARPVRVAKFALCLVPGTMLSASVGVATLLAAGLADASSSSDIWMTWWLGDVTGALVVAPFAILWTREARGFAAAPAHSLAIYAAAAAAGVIAFSPLIPWTDYRGPLGFLAIVPLMWAALRGDQRDTATVNLILAGFAVWGARGVAGPFATGDLNQSSLLFLMYLISISIPSLALGADAALRKQTEQALRRTQNALSKTVVERDAALEKAQSALESEIAQRRKLEEQSSETKEALADSERNFRLLVESVTDYALVTLDTDGCVTSWNLGAQRIKGYRADEIVGQHFDRFATDEDRAAGVSRHSLKAAARDGKFEGEGWRVRKDGTRFWASVVIYAIRGDDGETIGFAKVTRDITERRDAQAAIERAREQLATTQKMEAIGQLTGGVAHDFNNLLMIVSGHTEILHRRLADPKLMQAIEAIQTASKHGERLTRQLLAFSRQQRHNPEVVDLRERLASMRPMLASSLRENIRFTDAIAPDLWPIEVDTAEFELALVNVAVNARDAMADGGIFSMHAINAMRAPESPTGPLQGEFVAISLRDTGAGISKDILSKVFDPFFTTKAVGKGTGLGLSQVYGFAHQSGGTVTIESRPNMGATVTIYIPRSRKQVVVEKVPQRQAPKTKQKLGTILVVEDNSSVADVTMSLLDQIGYEPVRAESASAALALLESGKPFDLVFTDIVMPGTMNGVALARRVKSQFPDLPVILTTGYSEGLKLADPDFKIVRKPFVVSTLEEAVRSTLAARRNGGAAAAEPPEQKPSGTAGA